MAFTVPAPTKDATLTTSGSRRTISAMARWRSTIALNEMDCAASVTPMIKPGVLLRQQALGHDDVEPDRGHQGQRPRRASVKAWCRSTHCRLRS